MPSSQRMLPAFSCCWREQEAKHKPGCLGLLETPEILWECWSFEKLCLTNCIWITRSLLISTYFYTDHHISFEVTSSGTLDYAALDMPQGISFQDLDPAAGSFQGPTVSEILPVDSKNRLFFKQVLRRHFLPFESSSLFSQFQLLFKWKTQGPSPYSELSQRLDRVSHASLWGAGAHLPLPSFHFLFKQLKQKNDVKHVGAKQSGFLLSAGECRWISNRLGKCQRCWTGNTFG